MTDNREDPAGRDVVLQILNKHVDPAPTLNPAAGDYVSYFENALGEQWVFVRPHGAATGKLYGGDIGWEGHEVRLRTQHEIQDELVAQGARRAMIDQLLSFTRPDPLVPDLVLQDEEKSWLSTAWWASSSREDREAELRTIAAGLSDHIPADALNKHPNTTEYKAAHQTLALLTGRAAGTRGMTDDETTKLLAAVHEVIANRQSEV